MTTIEKHLSGLQQRAFQARAAITDGRTITAIGVPYNARAEIWPGYFEEFAPGSVDDTDAILRYGHREPIGKITASTELEAGRQIEGVISATARGDEVATLLQDGVLTRMSIGFYPDKYTVTETEEGQIIRHTKVKAVEYSVVEFPAFTDAKISEVREQPEPHKEGTNPMPTATETRLDDIERSLKLLSTSPPTAPVADTRSIGEVVRAVAARDESTITDVNRFMSRAYSGGTIADDGTLTPIWIKDLTRIIDNANPIARLFAKGPLPAEGMVLEYTQLLLNTIKVGKQEKEGDALPTGKVALTKQEGAKIETYGGATSLSFQEILRSRANMVSLSMKAMAVAAAKESATEFHEFYEAEVVKQTDHAITISKSLATIGWPDLLAMVLDASKAYQDLGLSLTGTIVDRATFLALGSMTGADDRPLMNVTGTGVNTVGRIDARNLKGDLSGLSFVPDFDSTLASQGISGAFYHDEALRQYTSGIGHLQDENILNLTRDMAVYYFAANAAEIPAGLIPLKFSA